MAEGKDSVPLMDQLTAGVRFADDSVDLQGKESRTPSTCSDDDVNSFSRHFPEFARFISGSDQDQDSDFEDLDGLPDVEFPDACQGFDVADGDEKAVRERPFKELHNPSTPFATIRPNCWIPGVPIQVKITTCERHQAHIKIFSPNLYTIAIKHGEYEWTVRRRYKHFLHLHQQLQLYKAKCNIPMPTKSQRKRRQSVRGSRNKIPRFPKKPELMVRDFDKRKKYLEDYLQNLLNIGVYRNHHETLKFLEVSQLSFVRKLGKKWREGAIRKCSGGRRISIGCCGCLKKFHFAGNWKKRWLVVKDSFVAYIRPRDGHICDVMLMDSDFNVDIGMGATGAPHGLMISNLSRNLLAKCWTGRKAEEWKESIENAMSTGMGADYTTTNRFNSFAPVREKSYAKWFVDGSTYFSAVAEALESAKEEIFITDWWLSPEIYLKRHTMDWNKWRLDNILERKAKEGVKVFILLYKEMSVALNISSIYSKHILTQKCPENIKVLRHPDHQLGGVLLWAHHEKCVCVDQKVAFVGGIDLCYGRWDDSNHKLTDLGCIVYDHNHPDHVPDIQVNGDIVEEELDAEGVHISIIPPSPYQSSDNLVAQGEEPDAKPDTNGCVCQGHQADSPHSYANSHVEKTNIDDIDKDDAYKRSDSVMGNIFEIDLPLGSNLKIDRNRNSVESERDVIEQCDRHNHSLDNHTNHKTVCKCDKCDSCKNRNHDNHHHEVKVTVHHGNSEDASSPDKSDSKAKQEETLRNIVNYMQSQSLASKVKAKTAKQSAEQDKEKSVLEINESSSNSVVIEVGSKHNAKNVNKKDEKISLIEDENDKEDIGREEDSFPMRKSAKEYRMELERSKKEKQAKKESNDKKTDDKKKSKKSKQNESGIIEKGFKKVETDLPVFIDPNEQQTKKNKDSGEVQMRKKLPPLSEVSARGSSTRESWARRKLRASLTKSRSLEEKQEVQKEEEEINEHIRSRWRLVLNVQKFQSTKQQPQMITPFPQAKRPLTSKISERIRDKLHDMRNDRRDSLDGIKEELPDYLDTPLPALHKTSSEMKIDELGISGSSKMWIGKDYVNFIYKDFVDLHDPFEDFIDRTETPRMPWHDIGCVVYGKSARDVSRHFIGRWNMTKVEKAKNNKNFPLLLPKGYTPHNLVPEIIRDQCDEVKSQILRSAGGWSCGINRKEISIQTAYLHCIESAKHYIYIENQFFITYVGDKAVVKNDIGDALYKRILRAHRNGETFRVYVVMPLLPAFEGEIGKSGAYAIKAITHYNYTSICKGPQSLWQQLVKAGVDPLNYIIFCGLRTHTELNKKLVSELVYVHSKLMIVDDDTVIVGSANINDRSMMGDRDSELAVMFQDIHKHKVKMNGIEHQAGKFASSLRKCIFREHLGLDPLDNSVDLSDPVCDKFYKNFYTSRATVNTGVYEKVFRSLPNNQVLSFQEADIYMQEKPMAETDPEKAHEELKKVKGYIVLMPLRFLDNETSIIPFGKEAFLPNAVWV